MSEEYRSLFEFRDQNEVAQFQAIDDRVMGGVSKSTFTQGQNNTAVYSGIVSLENNGGFASVRAQISCRDVSKFAGLALRVKGDGKRYKLRLMNSATFDEVLYQVEFQTAASTWQELTFPFGSFQPVWRGRELQNRPPFDSSKLCGIGFLISDKQVGKFSLLVDWIRAYS